MENLVEAIKDITAKAKSFSMLRRISAQLDLKPGTLNTIILAAEAYSKIQNKDDNDNENNDNNDDEDTWNLEIIRVNNGYVVKGRNDNNHNNTIVIEHSDIHDEDDLSGMEKLLFYIKEYFGVYYSKHNKKNLVIKIEDNKKD